MFNQRIKVRDLLLLDPQGQSVTVMGWVRTFRNNQFIALNDGSTNTNIQVVVELGKFDEALLKRITTSASLKVTGVIEPSLGKGQKMDLKATAIEILGDSDAEKYPLQPKKHRPQLTPSRKSSSPRRPYLNHPQPQSQNHQPPSHPQLKVLYPHSLDR